MVFNSIPFLIFILVFLVVYFLLDKRGKIYWSLLGSYVFYGDWDWRFLLLIMASTLVDYGVGRSLAETMDFDRRQKLLWISILFNLGLLAVFKYFNFFADSLEVLFASFGWPVSWNTLHIILPVGISFYTFQSMSYTIDIYRKEIVAEKDLLKFATYIAFFPQLVAGPIVRARDFLPQFDRDLRFEWNRMIAGVSQVLWGFFKKVVIADSLAPFVDQCFNYPDHHSALHLMLGVIFYSFQIYCDFSGYSDIAIGLARIMGFDFPVNFRLPYFSKNFRTFWRGWHISLSTWLRDYLYVPLGGNRKGTWMTYRNLMLTMLLGGLWHGASWVFVFWGFLHGVYLIGERRLNIKVNHPLGELFSIGLVYVLTCLAWVFFRSADFGTAIKILQIIGALDDLSPGSVTNKFVVLKGVLLIGGFVLVEIASLRLCWYTLMVRRPVLRYSVWCLLLWCIALLGTFGQNAFIYFQF